VLIVGQTGNLSRDRFGESGYKKGPPPDYPEYDFERRGLLRPETGDTGKGNGASDERVQRYPGRNGYDARLFSGARPLGGDGQLYNRPSGPGRGGAFSVSQSLDADSRGRGEMRARRMDPRIVEGPDGIRAHRIGVGSEGGDGRGYRVESRIPGREIGGRGVRIDSRGMGPDGRGSGLDSRGVGAVRGSGLRPDSAGLGAGSRGLRLDRDGGGEVRGRGSWQNEDEEEYVWDDIRPQGRDLEDRSGNGKVDEWYGGDMRRGLSSTRSAMEPGVGLEDWRRGGSGPHSEQFSGSAEMRAALRRVRLLPPALSGVGL
jgi:pre-mRNA cleavage complex 2 protein Pcf11